MHYFLAVVISGISITLSFAQNVAYTLKEKDLIPEGIAYDPTTEKFYLSSTYKRKIVEIDRKTGTYRDFINEKQDGIAGVIGLHVDAKRRILWAVTSTGGKGMPAKGISPDTTYGGVFKYSLESRKLLKKYLLKDAEGHFLNDLTVFEDGSVFITDTSGKKIYRITPQADSLEDFFAFKDPFYPNGITHAANEKLLYVAIYKNSPHSLLVLNVETKNYQVVSLPENEQISADGICRYRNEIIAIQPWNKERVIAKYTFPDNDYTRPPVITTLASDTALFNQPTTGVVVGNELYFIGTSQLQHFQKLFNANNGAYPASELTETLIMRIELE